MRKTAVITGGSSGIGRATAAILVSRGYMIYDLSRSENPQEGVCHIYCDVTQTETVNEAFKLIAQKEEKGIDLLILCAGMGVAGSVEHTTDTEMIHQFDVNTFGPVRVVRQALPLLRKNAKTRPRRRIVFVSSMAAQFGIPFQSMYSATKAAINSIAFSLSNEVRSQNITVAVVMPGDVKTNFKRKTNLEGNGIYPNMKSAISQMEHDEQNGLSAEAVAQRVVRAATRRHISLFNTSDRLSTLECLLQRLLPTSVALYVVRKLYHC